MIRARRSRDSGAAPRPPTLLVLLLVGLLMAGLFLGFSKSGPPLVPRARELYFPAAALTLVLAWWFVRIRRDLRTGAWVALYSTVVFAVAAQEAWRGDWALVAMPALAATALVSLDGILRGPRSGAYRFWERGGARRGKGWRPRTYCAWMLGFTGIGILVVVDSAVHGH